MTIRGRIVHLLGGLGAGGAERAALDLVIGMKRAGLRVEVIALIAVQDPVGDHWRGQLERAGVPVRVGPSDRMSLPVVLWLARELGAPDLAVVHVHVDYAERAYYLARFLHRRRYAVLRKLTNMQLPQGTVGFAVRHSDIRMSVAGGESTYEFFRERIGGELRCIPNGIDFHWPVYDPARRDVWLSELGLDPAKRHFLTIGSMRGASPDLSRHQKAHDTLIRSWQRAAFGAGAELHLLGTGNLLPRVQSLARGDESIRFHGLLVDVWRWLLAVDCFVLPSRWEGLPNAGIEAAGSGVPCIFSDIPPCRELGAANASFFPVDDVDGLSLLMRRRFEAPEPRIDVAHIEKVRQRYGIRRPLDDYCRLYEELLERDAPG